MFRPTIKICSKCHKKRLIVVGAGLCEVCNHHLKLERKANRHTTIATKLTRQEKFKVFSSLKRKFREPTGEKNIFLELWNERPHICTNCMIHLGDEPIAHFFSHIISKKRKPELRLEKTNIRLLCFECHYSYDFQGKEKFLKRKTNGYTHLC